MFPDLIFIINFSDQEYASIEHWLNEYRQTINCSLDQNITDTYFKQVISMTKIISDDAKVLNKRAETYLKGGVFAITYRQLVLDFMTKRLSPAIISGFIINQAHKVKGD